MEEARASGMKVTAKGLSLAAGCGETYVGDILRGRVDNPTMVKLARIAKQLKVPLSRLVPDDQPPSSYLELHEPAAPFHQERPLLDPKSLTIILAALPHALQRLPGPPGAARVSEAIYRAHGWILDETAAGRHPASDAVVIFLSHIL